MKIYPKIYLEEFVTNNNLGSIEIIGIENLSINGTPIITPLIQTDSSGKKYFEFETDYTDNNYVLEYRYNDDENGLSDETDTTPFTIDKDKILEDIYSNFSISDSDFAIDQSSGNLEIEFFISSSYEGSFEDSLQAKIEFLDPPLSNYDSAPINISINQTNVLVIPSFSSSQKVNEFKITVGYFDNNGDLIGANSYSTTCEFNYEEIVNVGTVTYDKDSEKISITFDKEVDVSSFLDKIKFVFELELIKDHEDYLDYPMNNNIFEIDPASVTTSNNLTYTVNVINYLGNTDAKLKLASVEFPTDSSYKDISPNKEVENFYYESPVEINSILINGDSYVNRGVTKEYKLKVRVDSGNPTFTNQFSWKIENYIDPTTKIEPQVNNSVKAELTMGSIESAVLIIKVFYQNNPLIKAQKTVSVNLLVSPGFDYHGITSGITSYSTFLKKQQENTDELSGYISGVEYYSNNISGDVSGLEYYVNNISGDVNTFESYTNSISGDVSGLEYYVNTVSGDLSGLESYTNSISGDVSGIEYYSNNISGDLSGLEQYTNNISGNLNNYIINTSGIIDTLSGLFFYPTELEKGESAVLVFTIDPDRDYDGISGHFEWRILSFQPE